MESRRAGQEARTFLLFSDIHRDIAACEMLVEKSKNADLLVGAGDYALFRKGLAQTIHALSSVKIPVVLVPGNHESYAELSHACRGLKHFHVLHGGSVTIAGTTLAGIGCGIPTTPFVPWSVDLSEDDAQRFLPRLRRPFVFVTHSPPLGCLDEMENNIHIGSRTIRTYIEQARPDFVACGHIHENWHRQSSLDGIPVINAGPYGYVFRTHEETT